MMSDYRIDVKVRNNNILRMIESRGYVSALQFCTATGYNYNTLNKLINMKEAPIGKDGDYRPTIHNLCDKLNCMVEELFSSAQMEVVLESNHRTFQVNEAEMKFMISNQQEQRLLEDIVDDHKREAAFEDMLDTLCPREKLVVERSFGLNNFDPHTYDQLAAHFDVTRERVRQIERKALTKLRHPSRRKILNGLFEGIEND
jgi:RNA polymerase primary sigma factor